MVEIIVKSNRVQEQLIEESPKIQLDTWELASVTEHFEKEEHIKALAILDKIVERTNSSIMLNIRASVREIVNDLVGSLEDITIDSNAPNIVLMKARVLAKLGRNEEATGMIENLLYDMNKKDYSQWSPLALGIAGRRFDLELLGLNPTNFTEFKITEDQWKGCAVEHLIALGGV
jgi:predicted acyltransferase (DUF342 family)